MGVYPKICLINKRYIKNEKPLDIDTGLLRKITFTLGVNRTIQLQLRHLDSFKLKASAPVGSHQFSFKFTRLNGPSWDEKDKGLI